MTLNPVALGSLTAGKTFIAEDLPWQKVNADNLAPTPDGQCAILRLSDGQIFLKPTDWPVLPVPFDLQVQGS